MTGNGIESDFVLPDSLFISDYSTLPSFYPHFGANCRFFCTISMSPDSSTPFASRTRGAASGLRQRVFDPLDSRSRDSVERIFILCPRADWGNPRGAAPGPRQRVFDPLDSLSRDCVGDALMLCPRADWGETQGALPLDPAKGSSTLWTPVRAIELVTLSCRVRVLIR